MFTFIWMTSKPCKIHNETQSFQLLQTEPDTDKIGALPDLISVAILQRGFEMNALPLRDQSFELT